MCTSLSSLACLHLVQNAAAKMNLKVVLLCVKPYMVADLLRLHFNRAFEVVALKLGNSLCQPIGLAESVVYFK